LSLPSVQPEAEPAEAAEAEQFTATGGIEVQGLDRRNPQRPQLRIVCGRAYRQLQVHAGNRRLAFNAPRPGELRRLPLPPEWAEPGTLLTLYGIESTTSEQLEWMVPPLQSGVGAGAQPAGAATTAADPTASESSREEQPQADDGQDSPPVDDLQPSTEPYREE
jgi:hypothetical protein